MAENFKDYVVAFIDFLGFKNFNSEGNRDEKFISFLREIKALDSDAIIKKEGHATQFRVASSFYSDSLVLAWPCDELPIVNEFVITTNIMPYIAAIAIKALRSFGLLIRGAITVGEFYHERGIFLGQALDEAYSLQSEVAIYPRIVISNEIFNRKLIQWPAKQDAPLHHRPWLRDFDHINFLNYLSIRYKFRDLFVDNLLAPRDEQCINEKIKQWIIDSSRVINENIKNYESKKGIKNIKILQKWQWFSDYFNNSIISLSREKWTGANAEVLMTDLDVAVPLEESMRKIQSKMSAIYSRNVSVGFDI